MSTLKNLGNLLTICGYLQAEHGVGEVGRILARGADFAGISYSTLTSARTLHRQDFGFEERRAKGNAEINLIAVNADQMKIWSEDVGPDVVEGRYNIGVWAWELEDFPEIYDEAFKFVDEIWAISDFTRKSIQKRTEKPVFTLPMHVPPSDSSVLYSLDRSLLQMSENDEYFLFMFDFLSEMERKNPHGVVAAFTQAFRSGSGPKLVIKTINGDLKKDEFARLLELVDGRPDIHVFDGYFDKSQRTALMAECLAYVSLHRSEGYGLTMAEAMTLGKPVIATRYSANLEFMTTDDSILVPCLMTSTLGNPTYPYDSYWADPDLAKAADGMRLLFDDRKFANELGEKARGACFDHSNVSTTASFMNERIMDICKSRLNESAGALAVPKDGLSALLGVDEDGPPSMEYFLTRADALAHEVADVDLIASARRPVRLVRKVLARLLAPFDHHDRLRHQAHVNLNREILRNLNSLSDLVSRMSVRADDLSVRADDLSVRADDLSVCSDDLSVRQNALIERLNEVDHQNKISSSRIRAQPFLRDSEALMLATAQGTTMGFNRVSPDETGLHLVDLFRPSTAELVLQLRRYEDYFPIAGEAVDLGCGRGEMLQVLTASGLSATGVDTDSKCVKHCIELGLRASEVGISSFLGSVDSDSLNLISAIQVIEHVDYETLKTWIREIFRALKVGGLLILETPNPHAIDAFKAFWIDPTHVRPYYPESLLIDLESAGFARALIDVQGEQPHVYNRLEFAGSYSVLAWK